jgi:hypothetical protein
MVPSPGKPSFEARVAQTLRSKVAGWIGLVLGLTTAALLLLALWDQISKGRTLLEEQTVWSILITFIGFAVFQIGAIISLSMLLGQPAAHLWAASQLAKYFPAPGASLGGMMHQSVRSGLSTRQAIGLTLRHSGILLGTALAVGAWALGSLAYQNSSIPFAPVFLVSILVAAVVLLASTRTIDGSRAWVIVLVSTAGWVALGLGLWLGIARSHHGGPVIVTAFCAAWAAGFIVLPVPAGIGIRETVLVFLLKPWLGQGGAVSFAILSRMLHIGSDGVLVAADVFRRHKERVPLQESRRESP